MSGAILNKRSVTHSSVSQPLSLQKRLTTLLTQRRQQNLYRARRISEGPQRPEMVIDGRRVVSFCSNDYLGLANHPKLIDTFKRAANQYGVGSGAAHLITGHSRVHHALEEELAEFTGRQRALLFSTGYMANLGVVSSLLRRGDRVFEDRLNHASLLDAGLLSRAKIIRYRHRDTLDLEQKLSNHESGEKLILTDGIFSMDGDIAPLAQAAKIAKAHDAWLMVDDAHGLGVIGNTGRGTLEHHGLNHRDVPILMGTLGKALGTFGAFVAGSDELIEALIQSARSYIYTTAPPPAIAEATRTSLKLIKKESWRREHLDHLITYFRAKAKQVGLPLMDSSTAIQPLMIGDPKEAFHISTTLLGKGFLVTAIRPPTVPVMTARLRITLSASHSEEQLEKLLETLSELMPPS